MFLPGEVSVRQPIKFVALENGEWSKEGALTAASDGDKGSNCSAEVYGSSRRFRDLIGEVVQSMIIPVKGGCGYDEGRERTSKNGTVFVYVYTEYLFTEIDFFSPIYLLWNDHHSK
jgi:hypothetical protein